MERSDLQMIIEKITVHESRLVIRLKSDVDALIRSSTLEETVNFKQGIEDILSYRLVQSAKQQKDKVFDVNVISDGDPLLTTLTPIDRFCWAIHCVVKRYNR